MERRRLKPNGPVVATEDEHSSLTQLAGPQHQQRHDVKLRQDKCRRFTRILLLFAFSVAFLVFPPPPGNESDWYLARSNILDACRGYQGILHIAQGDKEGAAGTIFFLFVLNQIMYAQEHRLIPWVHLNNASYHVHDPVQHGFGPRTIWVRDIVGASWTSLRDPISEKNFGFPGPPKWNHTQESSHSVRTRSQPVTVQGNGVWNSYFDPVSPFSHNDPSCQKLPLVRLSYSQIIPGLHLNCPWALRAWRYGGLPPSLRHDEVSYAEWFRPIRQRGSEIVREYVRFQPYLQQRAHRANSARKCLAIHVRHSDKANRRQKIALSKFLPYMDTFLKEVPAGKIYVATDSVKVLQKLQGMSEYQGRLHWQEGTLRSNDTTAVFRMTSGHHVTNIQVLVDILAMSKCQFLLHGLSAVSEAVLYVNPKLHQVDHHSINLELPEHGSLQDFRQALQHEYGTNSDPK